jgi:hypothetical protein
MGPSRSATCHLGEYKIQASSGRDNPHTDVAVLPIAVDGVDVDNVSLIGSVGGAVTGQGTY